MTTTQKTQEKQGLSERFKPNQHVFYIKHKIKAIVKTVDANLNKIYISYHPRVGNKPRVNKWVDAKYVIEWKEFKDRGSKKPPIRNKTYKNKDNRYYLAVKDFHTTFHCGVSEKPTPMSPELALARMSWDLEETIEMLHASSSSKEEFSKLYDQLVVNGYQSFLKLLNTPFSEDKLTAQVDAIGDKLYFNQGDFVLLGVKPDGIFDGIAASNMSKLWEDGLPRFREGDGKIIKSDLYVEPTNAIKTELERQLSEAV